MKKILVLLFYILYHLPSYAQELVGDYFITQPILAPNAGVLKINRDKTFHFEIVYDVARYEPSVGSWEKRRRKIYFYQDSLNLKAENEKIRKITAVEQYVDTFKKNTIKVTALNDSSYFPYNIVINDSIKIFNLADGIFEVDEYPRKIQVTFSTYKSDIYYTQAKNCNFITLTVTILPPKEIFPVPFKFLFIDKNKLIDKSAKRAFIFEKEKN
jgi:hypothetical protein